MSRRALLWADKFVLITITLSVSRPPVRESLFCAASVPRVLHLTGGALFPGRLFLVAGHLSCDASSIGGIGKDFSDFGTVVAAMESWRNGRRGWGPMVINVCSSAPRRTENARHCCRAWKANYGLMLFLLFIPIMFLNDLLELDFRLGIIGNNIKAGQVLSDIAQMLDLIFAGGQLVGRKLL